MLVKLLSGEHIIVSIANRISLKDLIGTATDQAFYSLLVQTGYLALCKKKETTAIVSIPNTELMLAWKELSALLANYIHI